MLETTDTLIEEIATEVGSKDEGFFRRLFRCNVDAFSLDRAG